MDETLITYKGNPSVKPHVYVSTRNQCTPISKDSRNVSLPLAHPHSPNPGPVNDVTDDPTATNERGKRQRTGKRAALLNRSYRQFDEI